MTLRQVREVFRCFRSHIQVSFPSLFYVECPEECVAYHV